MTRRRPTGWAPRTTSPPPRVEVLRTAPPPVGPFRARSPWRTWALVLARACLSAWRRLRRRRRRRPRTRSALRNRRKATPPRRAHPALVAADALPMPHSRRLPRPIRSGQRATARHARAPRRQPATAGVCPCDPRRRRPARLALRPWRCRGPLRLAPVLMACDRPRPTSGGPRSAIWSRCAIRQRAPLSSSASPPWPTGPISRRTR